MRSPSECLFISTLIIDVPLQAEHVDVSQVPPTLSAFEADLLDQLLSGLEVFRAWRVAVTNCLFACFF